MLLPLVARALLVMPSVVQAQIRCSRCNALLGIDNGAAGIDVRRKGRRVVARDVLYIKCECGEVWAPAPRFETKG